MIKCEECISFAICVNSITFFNDRNYSFEHAMHFGDVQNRCNYFSNITHDIHGGEYQSLKTFFLKAKGLIE
jgi:hypothetical protein